MITLSFQAELAIREAAPGAVFVYLFRVRDERGDAYKIGISDRPDDRAGSAGLTQLDTLIMACLPFLDRTQAREYEAELHSSFHSCRLRADYAPGVNGCTEWFALEDQTARVLSICFAITDSNNRRESRPGYLASIFETRKPDNQNASEDNHSDGL